MSVPVNKRQEGRLLANVKAKELCVYTLQITRNEKIFQRNQDSFTQLIRSTAIQIHTLAWEANNIDAREGAERQKRRLNLQSLALDKCTTLCALIDLAKPLFHLSSKRVKYWTEKTVEVRRLIWAWHTADKKRFEDL